MWTYFQNRIKMITDSKFGDQAAMGDRKSCLDIFTIAELFNNMRQGYNVSALHRSITFNRVCWWIQGYKFWKLNLNIFSFASRFGKRWAVCVRIMTTCFYQFSNISRREQPVHYSSLLFLLIQISSGLALMYRQLNLTLNTNICFCFPEAERIVLAFWLRVVLDISKDGIES